MSDRAIAVRIIKTALRLLFRSTCARVSARCVASTRVQVLAKTRVPGLAFEPPSMMQNPSPLAACNGTIRSLPAHVEWSRPASCLMAKDMNNLRSADDRQGCGIAFSESPPLSARMARAATGAASRANLWLFGRLNSPQHRRRWQFRWLDPKMSLSDCYHWSAGYQRRSFVQGRLPSPRQLHDAFAGMPARHAIWNGIPPYQRQAAGIVSQHPVA